MILQACFLFALLMAAIASRCRQNAAIYHFTIGNLQGTVLSDGPMVFAQNPFLVPPAAVQQSYDACFRASSPYFLSMNVVVLDTPSGRVLVDPGSRGSQSTPIFADAGLLFENLQATGISPASIKHILITHGHADHVNGLLSLDGGAAFPNAKVYVGRQDHRFWMKDPLPIPDDHPVRETLVSFGETYRRSLAPYTKQLVLVRRGASPLPGFRFIPTPGHSPGHSAIEVTSRGKQLILVGDAWISKPDQIQNPEWPVGTESDSATAFRSRTRLLKRIAKKRDLVLAYHEQFPGLGFVTQTGRSSFDWGPAPPQLLGTGIVQKC